MLKIFNLGEAGIYIQKDIADTRDDSSFTTSRKVTLSRSCEKSFLLRFVDVS